MDTISNGPPAPLSPRDPRAYANLPPPVTEPPHRPHGCLGAFLGICLALVFAFLLGGISLRLTLLNPSFWKTWLDKSGAYEQTTNVFLPVMFSSFSTNPPVPATGQSLPPSSLDTMPSEAAGIPPEVWKKLDQSLQQAVTPTWLRQQAEGAIDNFFGWVQAGRPLRIVFDLRPLRQPLAEAMQDVLRSQFSELPKCAANEQPWSTDAGLTCQVPGQSFDQLWEQIVAERPENFALANLPEEYVLDEAQWQTIFPTTPAATGWNEILLRNFSDPRVGWRTFMLWLWIAVAVLAGLVGLIILLYRQAVPSMLKVLAIPILVVSALNVASNLVGLGLLSMTTSSLATAGLPGGSTLPGATDQATMRLMEAAQPLQASFVREFSGPVLWLSVPCLALSITLLIVASWLRKN